MHLLRWNRLLVISGSMLWYLAAGVLLYLLAAPVNVESTGGGPLRRSAGRDAKPKSELPPIASFATVWHTPLQHPVFDPPPPPPKQEAKPEPPKLNAQLAATAVDNGVPAAMFRLPSGKFVTLKAGETFDNNPGTVKILQVDGKQVTLQFEGFDGQLILGVGK